MKKQSMPMVRIMLIAGAGLARRDAGNGSDAARGIGMIGITGSRPICHRKGPAP